MFQLVINEALVTIRDGDRDVMIEKGPPYSEPLNWVMDAEIRICLTYPLATIRFGDVSLQFGEEGATPETYEIP